MEIVLYPSVSHDHLVYDFVSTYSNEMEVSQKGHFPLRDKKDLYKLEIRGKNLKIILTSLPLLACKYLTISLNCVVS